MATGVVRMILIKANGAVYNLAQAQDAVNVFIETRDFAPSGDDFYTYIDTVISKIKNRVGSTGLLLIIKYRNRLEETLNSFPPLPLHINDKPTYPNRLPSSVYYKLRYEDTQLVNRWRLIGIEAFGEPDGHYF